jgi:hypothetical protein
MPWDAGFTPPELRRPITDRMAMVSPFDGDTPVSSVPAAPDPQRVAQTTPPPAAGAERRPRPITLDEDEDDDGGDDAPRTPERPGSQRLSSSDVGFIPPESRRAGSDRLARITPFDPMDPRRPSTARGHVEPRRKPTTPPPAQQVPDAASSATEPASRDLHDEPTWRGPGARRAALRNDRRTRDTLPSRPAPGDASSRERAPARPSRDAVRSPIGPGGPGSAGDASPYDRADPSLSGERAARRAPRPPSPAPRDHSVSAQLDGVLRGVAILVVLALGAAGLAQPTSVLRGGAAWLAFLFFALSGWGAIAARLARVRDPDAGLRVAFGAAGYLAIAGVLIAVGLLTRPAVLILIGIGFAGFAWRELTAPVAIWQRIRDGAAYARTTPALAALIGVLVALACVHLVGAVAALDRNPWDDDLAYAPFVKRLLDTGDLVEPFSFRRLGALGGQTALQALAAARGSLANLQLIDRGLGLGIALLLLAGHARERRTQPLWLALIALVVLVLPNTAINTASYWIGVAAFLALYRAVARDHWALAGALAGATCTLRQSFVVPAALFLACVLITRLIAAIRTMPAREAWHQERRSWALAGGTALAVVVPWWTASYLSSHTFLYPVLDGTWNHGLSLAPAVTSWPQELGFLVASCLDAAPLVALPILALALAFVVDNRPGRPLAALGIAAAAGFVLLVHGLLGSDAPHVWRAAFGFATALAIVLVLELGADEDGLVGLPPLGRWLVLAALVLQIVVGRDALPGQARAMFDQIGEAAAIDLDGDPAARAEQRRYDAMQAAIPAGGRAIAMLDDPALLDYRRNPIANLDIPGFASPGPQLPAFAGAEPLRAYFVAQGYRYAAFVRSERSRYAFRRAFWLDRLVTGGELDQIISAYTLDAIDSFAELATTTKLLYDADGLVVIDLATPLRDASRRAVRGDESARRGGWVRALADREGLHDAWTLTTRDDLRFESGTGALHFVAGSPADRDGAPARRGTAVLPVSRRAHLRVWAPGARDMRLAVRATIALDAVYSHPRLDISLDGALLASAVADAAGNYAVATTVARDRLPGGWHDLYLVFSSVAEPDQPIADPRIARLESIEWSPP